MPSLLNVSVGIEVPARQTTLERAPAPRRGQNCVTPDRCARLALSGKSARQKLAAVAQALGIDAVAGAR